METLLLISTITDILMTIMLERKDKLIHQVSGSVVAKPSQCQNLISSLTLSTPPSPQLSVYLIEGGRGCRLLPSTIFYKNVVATVALYLHDYGCSGWRGDRCAARISFESEAWID